MRAFITLMVTTILSLLSINPAGAAEHADYMCSNSNMGTSFMLAFPENDRDRPNQEKNFYIYISSFMETEVQIYNLVEFDHKTITVTPEKQTVISLTELFGELDWEAHESEVTGTMAVYLKSEYPVSVSVLSVKGESADGYLALPVSAWGRDYYHCSYYDNGTWDSEQDNHAGGFMIIARDSATKVIITLNGKDEGQNGQTEKGRHIGEIINVTLNIGETYMVRGDGQTSGSFDLSGTHINASRPVGVISFHSGTKLPAGCMYGRQYLSSMLQPVDQWGKEFVTVELPREKKKGDYFRITAAEDTTILTISCYDLTYYTLIGTLKDTINKGEIFEYHPTKLIDENVESMQGMSVIKSGKPVQVMQYAYSHPWDMATGWNPFMMNLPPAGQYQKNAVINIGAEEFRKTWLTIIARGDSADEEMTLINSLRINGQEIDTLMEQFRQQRVPGTDYYWCRIAVSSGRCELNSDTDLFAYVCGLSDDATYGWPALTGTNDLSVFDTLKPKLELMDDRCGRYMYRVSEAFTAPSTDSPRQVDSGIRNLFLLQDETENFRLSFSSSGNQNGLNPLYQTVWVAPVDYTMPGYTTFVVIDKAGNYIEKKLTYEPELLEFSATELDFGILNAGESKELPLVLTNNTSSTFKIYADVNNGLGFSISDNLAQRPVMLPGSRIEAKIKYSPAGQPGEVESYISLRTECVDYKIPLNGNYIAPAIQCSDYSFKTIKAGSSVTLTESNGSGLLIENKGSGDLVVEGFTGINAPFELNHPDPALPVSIAPGASAEIKGFTFAPIDSGAYNCEVTVRSNSTLGDSTFILSGNALPDDTGVDECPARELILYPNPASGRIVIENATPGFLPDSYEIYNDQGALAGSGKPGHDVTAIDIRMLPPGNYTLVLKGRESSITQKFIIAR